MRFAVRVVPSNDTRGHYVISIYITFIRPPKIWLVELCGKCTHGESGGGDSAELKYNSFGQLQTDIIFDWKIYGHLKWYIRTVVLELCTVTLQGHQEPIRKAQRPKTKKKCDIMTITQSKFSFLT